jgi:hypothetical protein
MLKRFADTSNPKVSQYLFTRFLRAPEQQAARPMSIRKLPEAAAYSYYLQDT